MMNRENRRIFFKKLGSGLFSFSALSSVPSFSVDRKKATRFPVDAPVYFTTGFKMMEVQKNGVLVWTRLCRQKTPNPIRHRRREQVFRHPIDFDEEQPVEKMDGGVEGSPGVVRMKLVHKKEQMISDWIKASAGNDGKVVHEERFG